MAVTDEQSVDALIAQVQAGAEDLAAAGADSPGAAAALEQAAAATEALAGEIHASDDLTPEAPVATAPATPAPPAQPAQSAQSAPSPVKSSSAHAAAPAGPPANPELHRLLAIEVPVIVRLGMRRMTVGEVMRLDVGAIIEFAKSAEEELELLVNNIGVGKGQAVKVGENFGIKLTKIGSLRDTIKKLGGIA